jgi:uncharacterized protein YjlB
MLASPIGSFGKSDQIASGGVVILLESIKKLAEQTTGWRTPAKETLDRLVQRRKPRLLRFKDDGAIPNNPKWPLVMYKAAVLLPDSLDPAATFEALFDRNGWGNSWRNGIYNFVHYHSRIHEVLGIARGSGKVQFGGAHGRALILKAGDVVILPAGTGHECLEAAKDFLVVGAYPPFGTYDECRGSSQEHSWAVKTVRKVRRPKKDPIYGRDGPLLEAWAPVVSGAKKSASQSPP